LQRLFSSAVFESWFWKQKRLTCYASCLVSSRDLRRFSSNRVLTITTGVSSVAVTGCPLLASSWMRAWPSRKRDADHDTALWSTTLSPQTSCKALWI
jgi:hypothetical protein